MEGSSFFQRLKSGLTKSRESWAQKIGDMFQNRRWDEASLEAMEENLIAADVGVKATQKLMNLLRNQSPPSSSWLLVKLIGTKTNRAAIGSRVVVEAENRRQVQEVRSGGSFCSQNDLRLHFGLGAAKDARLRIRWLGGASR